MISKTTNRFSPEVHARPVRVVLNHEREHSSRDGNVVADRYGAIAPARARSAVQVQRGTPPVALPRPYSFAASSAAAAARRSRANGGTSSPTPRK
jgi:hypothetical protein